MKNRIGFGALTLALAAAPLAAQISPRTGGTGRTGTTARDGVQSPQDVIDAARARIEAGRTGTRSTSSSSHIPPGHLPPRGLCRVWIDGVPPGQQPPVTSCAQAESDRFRYSNARVIYGDRESFRGRGKGKFKNANDARSSQRQCTIWDGVVVNGRVENVCRDGSVSDRRSGRVRDRDQRDDDDDDNRWGRGDDDRDHRVSQSDKAGRKAAKAHAKAAMKANKGHGKG